MVEEVILHVMKTVAPTVYNKIMSNISEKNMKNTDLILLSLCIIAENNLQICKSIDTLVHVINKMDDKLNGIEKALLIMNERMDVLIKHTV